MTQNEAAERIGVSRNYLSEIERGDKRYNQDTLEGMAKAYKCKVPDLFRDPAANESKWAHIFDNIPPANRSLALRTAEGFAEFKRDGEPDSG
jgi:transcriptional regulator with XRE-family HTH domain